MFRLNAVVLTIHEAVNAILQPLVALFADHWTTRVATTDALAFLRTGAQHVSRQNFIPLRLTVRVGKRPYRGLSQNVVISRVYAYEH